MANLEKMLFELQVDAFLEGVTEYEPRPEEYGLTPEQGAEIVAQATLSALTPRVQRETPTTLPELDVDNYVTYEDYAGFILNGLDPKAEGVELEGERVAS